VSECYCHLLEDHEIAYCKLGAQANVEAQNGLLCNEDIYSVLRPISVHCFGLVKSPNTLNLADTFILRV
jgi:hypothetical protein